MDENGCETKGIIPVSIHPVEIDITIESDESDNDFIYAGASITLVATENSEYTYSWAPSSSLDNPTIATPTATPTENTEYQLIVSNEQGCTATASIGVEVQGGICEEPYIFLPNAFTPDAVSYTHLTLPTIYSV